MGIGHVVVTRNTGPSVRRLLKTEVKPNLFSNKSWFSNSQRVIDKFIPWYAIIKAVINY